MAIKEPYWIKRERLHTLNLDKYIATQEFRILDLYTEAAENIQEELFRFYGQFADDNGMSMELAQKTISQFNVKQYSKKVDNLLKDVDKLKQQDLRNLKLYNVTMKTSRLEYLKQNIEIEMLETMSSQAAMTERELTKQAMEEYKRQSGILGMTIDGDPTTVAQLVSASFLGATFAERIWGDFDDLTAILNKQLTIGITQGLNGRTLGRNLRKHLDVTQRNAERLLITELSRIRADVFGDSMDHAGYTHYQYHAEPTACDICADLHGKVFAIKNMVIGENMYPMHPYCMCSTSGYESREDFEAELKRLGLDLTPEEQAAANKEKDPVPEYEGDYDFDWLTDKEALEMDDLGELNHNYLTSDEKKAWNSYISGGGSHDMNSSLYDPESWKQEGFGIPKYVKEEIKHMSSAANKGIIPKNMKVLRTVDGNYLDGLMEEATGVGYKVDNYSKELTEFDLTEQLAKDMNEVLAGTEHVNKGFTSTSYDRRRTVYDQRPIEMRINTPGGTKAFITNNDDEAEIVFNKDLKFRITKVSAENVARARSSTKKPKLIFDVDVLGYK